MKNELQNPAIESAFTGIKYDIIRVFQENDIAISPFLQELIDDAIKINLEVATRWSAARISSLEGILSDLDYRPDE